MQIPFLTLTNTIVGKKIHQLISFSQDMGNLNIIKRIDDINRVSNHGLNCPRRRGNILQIVNNIQGFTLQPNLPIPFSLCQIKIMIGSRHLHKVVSLDSQRECHHWDKPTIRVSEHSPTTSRSWISFSLAMKINLNTTIWWTLPLIISGGIPFRNKERYFTR